MPKHIVTSLRVTQSEANFVVHSDNNNMSSLLHIYVFDYYFNTTH